MTTYSYSHYSGAGNSFFLFDNREKNFPFEIIPSLCKKQRIDGIILLEGSAQADFAMRIFNPDAGEAEMCGNGLRCFIKFLRELNLFQKVYRIETKAGIHQGWMQDEDVCIKMTDPKEQRWHIEKNLHFLNTGVPHAVSFVEDLEKLDLTVEGPKIRYHAHFSPRGANVNFVRLLDKAIAVRTYERGVEGETLACGTGAVASAIAAARLFAYTSPVTVIVRSQEKLKIFFSDEFKEIKMQGPATFISSGSFSLNDKISIIDPL